jgi:hypothetical protein
MAEMTFLETRNQLQQLLIESIDEMPLSPEHVRDLLHLAMNLAELGEGLSRRVDELEEEDRRRAEHLRSNR